MITKGSLIKFKGKDIYAVVDEEGKLNHHPGRKKIYKITLTSYNNIHERWVSEDDIELALDVDYDQIIFHEE